MNQDDAFSLDELIDFQEDLLETNTSQEAWFGLTGIEDHALQQYLELIRNQVGTVTIESSAGAAETPLSVTSPVT